MLLGFIRVKTDLSRENDPEIEATEFWNTYLTNLFNIHVVAGILPDIYLPNVHWIFNKGYIPFEYGRFFNVKDGLAEAFFSEICVIVKGLSYLRILEEHDAENLGKHSVELFNITGSHILHEKHSNYIAKYIDEIYRDIANKLGYLKSEKRAALNKLVLERIVADTELCKSELRKLNLSNAKNDTTPEPHDLSTPTLEDQENTRAAAIVKGISKSAVINAFNGIYYDRNKWSRYLSDPPVWLRHCRTAREKRGTIAIMPTGIQF